MKKVQKLEELYTVKSTNIAKVGYHEGNAYVEFTNGNIYKYPRTDRSIIDQIVRSDSVGSVFSKTLRKASEYEKLEDVAIAPSEDDKFEKDLVVRLTLEYNGNQYTINKKFTQELVKTQGLDKILSEAISREAAEALKNFLVRMQSNEEKLSKSELIKKNKENGTCGFCGVPCGTDWCVTKKKKEKES